MNIPPAVAYLNLIRRTETHVASVNLFGYLLVAESHKENGNLLSLYSKATPILHAESHKENGNGVSLLASVLAAMGIS